jgi:hypothetical protein
MRKNETPDIALGLHNCPQNHKGSLKGMEVKAALECVNRVWSRSETRAFIDIIYIDNDPSRRAYLSHCCTDLDEMKLPHQATKAAFQKHPKEMTREDYQRTIHRSGS